MMKRMLLLLAALLVVSVANAATYTVQVAWSDPTTAGPEYLASYDAQCHVNGGAYTQQTGLSVPAASFTGVVASAGDTIACQVRAINVLDSNNPIAGNWSADVAAVAPIIGTIPSDQNNISITVTH